MTRDANLDRYTVLRDGGASAQEVYRAARQDGLSRIEGIRALRSYAIEQLFPPPDEGEEGTALTPADR
jgi:hypothetical protein